MALDSSRRKSKYNMEKNSLKDLLSNLQRNYLVSQRLFIHNDDNKQQAMKKLHDRSNKIQDDDEQDDDKTLLELEKTKIESDDNNQLEYSINSPPVETSVNELSKQILEYIENISSKPSSIPIEIENLNHDFKLKKPDISLFMENYQTYNKQKIQTKELRLKLPYLIQNLGASTNTILIWSLSDVKGEVNRDEVYELFKQKHGELESYLSKYLYLLNLEDSNTNFTSDKQKSAEIKITESTIKNLTRINKGRDSINESLNYLSSEYSKILICTEKKPFKYRLNQDNTMVKHIREYQNENRKNFKTNAG